MKTDNKENKLTLDTIAALAKRRGFVYQTSAIYGGLANSYDYGPLGSELMRNIRNLWWKTFISTRQDMFGLDSQILLHPKTWEASGHTSSFTDPLVEDKETHKRYRADHLIEEWIEKKQATGNNDFNEVVPDSMSTKDMDDFIKENNIKSPEGNEVTEPKDFKLLFETEIGTIEGEKNTVYLRGETAQGIFTNFKQILDTTRTKLPFGVGQIGKSFRNEITSGQFVFRTLEFEQAEIEYFFDHRVTDWKELFKQWQESMMTFAVDILGIDKNSLRWRKHSDEERSHYSTDTYDLDYKFPFGWKELWGVAYRTNYDLKVHMKHSGKSLEYLNPQTGEKFLPHVIEPALGLARAFLMTLCNAYWEDTENNRTVLKLDPKLAPYKAAIFPLVKNKPDIVNKAKDLFSNLSNDFSMTWDERGNIGKRYLSQDEIGTPICITVDYQTLEDNTVTIRHRDTTEQERIDVNKLEIYLRNMLR